MDKGREDEVDIFTGIFNLLDRYPHFTADHLLGLLSLLTLFNITNLLKPVTLRLPKSELTQTMAANALDGNLMQTLTGLLHNKNHGGGINTGDIASLLTKNPTALMSLMNMLSTLKEKNPTKNENQNVKKIVHEESKSIANKDKNNP
ncbi:hypothetical protein RDV78_07465 [Bacillota bacterium LX-D]|nr:hypothetical protein [Bacillota bacterium LX-D]